MKKYRVGIDWLAKRGRLPINSEDKTINFVQVYSHFVYWGCINANYIHKPENYLRNGVKLCFTVVLMEKNGILWRFIHCWSLNGILDSPWEVEANSQGTMDLYMYLTAGSRVHFDFQV